MKLIGLMLCRNEDWILGLSARVALLWCDELVILNHASTDRTAQIIRELQDEYVGRIIPLKENDPKWDEMPMRQRMLEVARHIDATHIAMIDADEIVTANWLDTWYDASNHILQLPLYNLRGGIDRYHANGLWGNRIVSVAFKDSPELHWSGDTFHQREPRGRKLQSFQPIAQGEGGILHFWCASIERCRAKHRAYRIHERLRWPEKDVRQIEFTYAQWERGGLREVKWTYNQVPDEWLAPYAQWMKHLHLDAAPWQDAWCDEMIALHGRDTFKGLSV